jgi:hypothetical protein
MKTRTNKCHRDASSFFFVYVVSSTWNLRLRLCTWWYDYLNMECSGENCTQFGLLVQERNLNIYVKFSLLDDRESSQPSLKKKKKQIHPSVWYSKGVLHFLWRSTINITEPSNTDNTPLYSGRYWVQFWALKLTSPGIFQSFYVSVP